MGTEQICTVRSAGVGNIEGMHRESDDRWYCETPVSEIWPLLQVIQAAGHQLIEVKPTLNLESAFMRYLGLEERGNKP